jgi:hypothetical protein
MRSPFPGMDPYLERDRGDVHARLIMYTSDWIQGRLPRDLRSRVEEPVVIAPPGEPARATVPDVRVVERPRRVVEVGSGTAVDEPDDAQWADALLREQRRREAR